MINPIGITMGDPAGIGPEIIVKMYAEGVHVPSVVVGDVGILERAVSLIGAQLKVVAIEAPYSARFQPGTIEVIQSSALDDNLLFGVVDKRAGKAAYDYVERAIELAKTGEIRAIVTAPINKEALKAAGVNYPGHTEILAAKSHTADFAMMLVNEELRVLLVTLHVSLSDAISLINEQSVLRAIHLADEACLKLGIMKPRIAVAGLNPHAGENGLFGNEDREIIAPAIRRARLEGIDATGPWPGDTIFMRARKGEFDIVIAQYHDQGLIPIKYGGIETGVNITVGLPFVRTSVDHGTAFDIAGRGRASPASLKKALEQADIMTREQEMLESSMFIFMLTRQDATIPNALEILPEALGAGVRHIGFKDVGMDIDGLQRLAKRIRAAGGRVYLEVVSLDEEAERTSAMKACELEVDFLLGGTRPEVVLPIIRGTSIQYFPFAGEISGHPSRLKGTIDTIVQSACRLASMEGVHGIDLLAYRFDGDVPRLIRETCQSTKKPVIVAGSIDCRSRIRTVIQAGAAGFTIGTAALDGAFAPEKDDLKAQLVQIQDSMKEAYNDGRSWNELMRGHQI